MGSTLHPQLRVLSILSLVNVQEHEQTIVIPVATSWFRYKNAPIASQAFTYVMSVGLSPP